MASSSEVMASQTKHEFLADFIKSVHGNLRKNVCKANGDFQTVWREHCANESLLKSYAEAMKELAVEHWGGNNVRRIEWCREICVEYFHGGGEEKCLRKDCRRILMNLEEHQNCSCADDAGKLEQILTRGLVKESKLLLLDVGSCFNPFQAHLETFIPVAIDLRPADKTVFTCDFLQLDICKQNEKTSASQQPKPSSSMSDNNCLFPERIKRCINGNGIKQLPGDVFHVVVFCLLLSYLPAKAQRWECCKKARELLVDGGLLVIVTPDSSHQNKNVEMMKSWRAAIESLGFARWKYYKDSHAHYMAFRKKALCGNLVQEDPFESSLSEMLYIPQDFQDDGREEKVNCNRRDSDESNSLEGLRALPFSIEDIG